MAHNGYIRPPGSWVGVIFPSEWEELALEVFQSLNADLGGTWAPAAQIVIGGAGLRITGDGQLDSVSNLSVTAAGTVTIADGATVTIAADVLFDTTSIVQIAGTLEVEGSGQIDVIDGGFISIDASSAFNLGGTMTVAAGGILNVSGALNVKTGGALEAESGSNIVVDSGANIEVAGHLKLNNGSVTDFFNGSTTTFASGAALTINSPTTIAGAQTVTGAVTRSGSGARVRRRIGSPITNIDGDVTVAADHWFVTNSGASTINITARTTGTVPLSGETLKIRTLGGSSAIVIKCEVAGTMATFSGGGNIGGCELVFDGTRWRIQSIWDTTAVSAATANA
jgi:hypothetical protein